MFIELGGQLATSNVPLLTSLLVIYLVGCLAAFAATIRMQKTLKQLFEKQRISALTFIGGTIGVGLTILVGPNSTEANWFHHFVNDSILSGITGYFWVCYFIYKDEHKSALTTPDRLKSD